ncbi:hypothetical protein SK3146_02794 [Paenibacillus konkukensis]|uniref:Uncharacterized protein n=1 Tax=Paenibacillus konkukensis TaxID=2020716 RepID=A0ABY4RMA1_9BACL|nr:hypothetical protein [Paenibacillus konkukensis]UQZ83607.1 hypothetical protein SK3146_02794 [Paenibacillus konkukensis]
MIMSIAQVTRTYRTNALWQHHDDYGRRQAGAVRSVIRPRPADTPAADRATAFEPQAYAAARHLAEVIFAARQAKDLADARSAATEADSDETAHSSGTQAAPLQEREEGLAAAHGAERLKESCKQLQAAVTAASPWLDAGAASEALSGLSLRRRTAQPDDDSGALQPPSGSSGAGNADTSASASVAADAPLTDACCADAEGLAAALSAAAGQLLSRPPGRLLDPNAPTLRSFAHYGFNCWDGGKPQAYLPVPLAGLLLNRYL